MSYTIGQAAIATGKSKSTISRAVDAGRISATRNADGSFTIEAVELHRVFPPKPATVAPAADEAPRNTVIPADDSVLVLQERIEGLKQWVRILEEQNRDLIARLDQSHAEKMGVMRLIEGPKHQRRGIWPFRRNTSEESQ